MTKEFKKTFYTILFYWVEKNNCTFGHKSSFNSAPELSSHVERE